MKAIVLQRKCYLLDKQQAGRKHAIPQVILLILSVIQTLSPFEINNWPEARGTADFRGETEETTDSCSVVPSPPQPRRLWASRSVFCLV